MTAKMQNPLSRPTTSAPTSDGQVRRTNLDVIRFVLETSCGPAAWEAFKRDQLPRLRHSPEAYRELTESAYQAAIQQAKKELPNFLRWLLNQQF
jgi:hypothetical protein